MNKHIFILMISSLFLLVSFIGCGYTTHSNIDPNLKSIYIKHFENKIDFTTELSEARKIKTYFPQLETKITNAIVDRFLFDGNLDVTKEDRSDVVLEGELIDYIKDPLRYDDNNNVLEYRLSLVVNMKLWDNKNDKYIWEEPSFYGQATYFTSGSLAKSESTALNDAVVDLARRIVERTIENW